MGMGPGSGRGPGSGARKDSRQSGWRGAVTAASSGRGGEVVYEGQPITGRVDLEFDIGPEYYNFVDVRYIGDPVLR